MDKEFARWGREAHYIFKERLAILVGDGKIEDADSELVEIAAQEARFVQMRDNQRKQT